VLVRSRGETESCRRGSRSAGTGGTAGRLGGRRDGERPCHSKRESRSLQGMAMTGLEPGPPRFSDNGRRFRISANRPDASGFERVSCASLAKSANCMESVRRCGPRVRRRGPIREGGTSKFRCPPFRDAARSFSQEGYGSMGSRCSRSASVGGDSDRCAAPKKTSGRAPA